MKYFSFILFMLLVFTSCIQDDIVFDTVEPELRIIQAIDTIALDSTYQFEALYLNNVGVAEAIDILWETTAPDIIAIDANGLATALQPGSATITASFDDGSVLVQDAVEVHTGEATISLPGERIGIIRTTSSYLLEGDFILREQGENLQLDIADNYRASTALPGLYIYLTNNPNTIANALEIGAVETFNGEHSYTIANTSLDTYNYVLYFCKPFNVKVGDGRIE